MSNTQHNGLNRILDARYHQQGDDSAEAMTLARWLVLEFLGSQGKHGVQDAITRVAI